MVERGGDETISHRSVPFGEAIHNQVLVRNFKTSTQDVSCESRSFLDGRHSAAKDAPWNGVMTKDERNDPCEVCLEYLNGIPSLYIYFNKCSGIFTIVCAHNFFIHVSD